MFRVSASWLLLLFSSLGNNGVVAWTTPSPLLSTGARKTYGNNKVLLSRKFYSNLHREKLFMSVDEEEQTVDDYYSLLGSPTHRSLQLPTEVMATMAAIATIALAPSMATAASSLVEPDTAMMAAASTTSIMTAKSGAAGAVVPSALWAYLHYVSVLVATSVFVAERFQVKPNMTMEEESRLGWTDTVGGLVGIPLVASGYYRVTQYGKGWDFYSHEPIFWVKIGLIGALLGLSLFPTIIIVQRTVQINQVGEIEPMSEKLANRMISILNAELSAVAFIPLAATFMARGVGTLALDNPSFPTNIVGPVLAGLLTVASSYKYVKEALEWTEDDALPPGSSVDETAFLE